jgi:hypothetical protein
MAEDHLVVARLARLQAILNVSAALSGSWPDADVPAGLVQ